MEITFLPPDYLINATRKVNLGLESDVLLRALRIKNKTSGTIKLKRIQFDIRIKDKTVRQVVYPEEMLESLARTLTKNIENIRGKPAQIFLGTERFWDNKRLSSTPTLRPNQETGVLLEHFKILRKDPIDECAVSVFYTQNDEEQSSICRIPVIQYENKNSYIFPLKGNWLVVYNYDNTYTHRRCHSQGFAIDLIQLTDNLKLVRKKRSYNEDYPAYGKEVYAVADGEVVDCFNEFPENPPGFGSRLPKEEWDRLKKEYGFVAGIAGNYVILKHVNNEYSFYAHMVPRSLSIKKGDLVKQGQVIGLVGNSGNSDAPHLHFHLMNGQSILSARGLPCRFSNIKDITGEKLTFIDENNSIVYAE
jgi:hypothetical protein